MIDFSKIDDDNEYFQAIINRKEALLNTGLFSIHTSMTLRLKGANIFHGVRTGEWWFGSGNGNLDFLSTEKILEMIQDQQIKTELLFHLDLL